MKARHVKAPALARWLLCLMRHRSVHESLIGDYDELFQAHLETDGKTGARIWYWGHVLRSVAPFLLNSLVWRVIMLKNYLKVAFRALMRRKGYSIINIFGLALAMAGFFLIYMYIGHERSFDRFHENGHHIYRANQLYVNDGQSGVTSWTPFEVGRALKEEFPEVNAVTRIYRLTYMEMVVRYQNLLFKEEQHRLVDPDFFSMFSFPCLYGDPETFFSDINSVVLSAETARKYFEETNPVGEQITINDQFGFTVTGVIDFPDNTDFKWDFLFPLQRFEDQISLGWGGMMYQTYVQMREGTDLDHVSQKITDMQRTHLFPNGQKKEILFQPLSRVRFFHPNGEAGKLLGYINLFAVSGVFLLLIGCINYMNLSTARSEVRAREVGLRKTIGASRGTIARQFLFESLVTSALALALSGLLALLILPLFSHIIGYPLRMDLGDLSTLTTLFFIWLGVSLGAGAYPALVLSSFRPVQVIRGVFHGKRRGAGFRTGLVILQFTLAVLFIISTLVIHDQMHFIHQRYSTLEKESLIYLTMDGDHLEKGRLLKNHLKKLASVEEVTVTQQLPVSMGYYRNIWISKDRSPESDRSIAYNMSDFDFVKTFHMELVAGRDFSQRRAGDGMNCLINESAVDYLGLESPVGSEIVYWDGKPGKIIGIIKDFNYQHVSNRIGPMILCARPEWRKNYIAVRLAPGDLGRMVKEIETVWESTVPQMPFDLHFFDAIYNRIYSSEERLRRVALGFTVLSITISCLGLLGLAAFMAQRRTREIGIRKVLGASAGQMIVLISSGFIRRVLVANFLAWPLSYLLMRKWLNGFAFRTRINGWIFPLSLGIVVSAALITVAWQTWRSASANPVKALQNE